jgi:hypothetical protein
MNENSRVWIHTSNRKLTNREVEWIESEGQKFCANWAAHGNKLSAKIHVVYHHFIVTVIDEENASASGCSIDKLIHWIQAIGDEIKVDFFDRRKVAFLNKNHGEEVILYDFSALKQLYENKVIDDNTLIFNSLLDNFKTLSSSWLVPFHQSKYFSFVN